MTSLRDLQTRFADALFAGEANSDKLHALAQAIHSTAKLSGEGRISVYAGSLRANITDALMKSYPVCAAIVGTDNFRYLSGKYLEIYPSRSQNLNHYGAHFAELLESLDEIQADMDRLPFFSDLARLEWHYDQVFFAADDPSFDPLALQQIPEEKQGDLIFSLSASIRLFQSPYALVDVWNRYQRDPPTEIPTVAEQLTQILVWRPRFHRRVDLLTNAEWLFLSAVGKRLAFDEICTQLSADNVDLVALLPHAVQRGWIVGFAVA